jgi:phosphohistidine phosphatase SixA
MKQVFVLRHAHKNILTGGISKKGEEQCQEIAKLLPTFDIAISSEKKRAKETAMHMTNTEPLEDNRANIEHDTGKELIELIKETIKKLENNQNALIISHSPAMTAAYYILTKQDAHFNALQGFEIDDKGNVKKA